MHIVSKDTNKTTRKPNKFPKVRWSAADTSKYRVNCLLFLLHMYIYVYIFMHEKIII